MLMQKIKNLMGFRAFFGHPLNPKLVPAAALAAR